MIDKLSALNVEYIHFIGIGGISMSGLAEILHSKGYKVAGSDWSASPITEKLKNLGIKVFIGHNEANIDGAEFIIYTAAVKDDNPELEAARAKNIPTMDRATLLGLIMKEYPGSIAVSGTHGKTTTSSMISMIMLEAGLDPTIQIGGVLESIGGTTHLGSSGNFVAEACEYCGSFLKFYPHVAVILNIDFDHADYFRDIEHVKNTFINFASHVPKEGFLVASSDDKNIEAVLSSVNCNICTFGLSPDKSDWSAVDIDFDNLACAKYTLVYKGSRVCTIELRVPGIHNVSNSLAAIAASSIMGAGTDAIISAFKKFTGTQRRFEYKGIINNIKVIDDYAHHPSEVEATLKAVKNCKHLKTWCVFQPHTYTRTKSLMNEFSTAFKEVDKVILADIYAARELDTGDVNSSMLADNINAIDNKAIYIKGFDEIVKYLRMHAKPGDLVITMGAGDIFKVGEMFLNAANAS